ncbi:Serine/threonine protein kinase [Nannocystis exedens]|uniref:Serine/threonine protein kinase n=1 Tax=Nannocystis exedens TaxID=54 RepID=A0A1I1UCB8_9BACT|nr:protein kinase [Nannocystis exedens]PCC71585.1 serine/threonine protein kinase [Nannocystis exedens]SFD68265.1 Serine/threonine protein kinase [Nannocystis exedens]
MESDEFTPGGPERSVERTPVSVRGEGDTVPRAMESLKKVDDPIDKQLVKRALFPRRATPVQIGRFQILGLIGRGGMGVVYAAYDDLLDRKIAVKVLLGESVRDVTLSRGRLMREAQAMARLSHPNIVTVHEVGQDNGQVFVAMEFVRGTSLDAWAQEERPWREVVATFVRAGRGLEAAHRAGLIHRDFKPANVMVGEDGAVKVLDFGLARAADDSAPGEPDLPRHIAQGTSALAPLTRTGVVLGTPAYMSPEAHRGEASTAASDQFSFCVSLYQCLYRRSPFDTTSMSTLLADVLRGRIAAPPAGSPVPARIFRAIRRGLSPAPAERFPSMTALLSALERDPGATYRRAAALVVTAGVTAFAGFFAAARGDPAVQVCPDAEAELAGVWDAARAGDVRAALTALRTPAAEAALAAVLPRLDRYAASWVEMRNETCRAHAEARQSTQLFELRTACLDQRRAGLDALAAALTQVDAASLDSAVEALAELPPPARCADAQQLPPPKDPRLRLRVQAHRETLARAKVREDAGQYPLGRALVDEVLADGDALAYEPLRAEALLRAGSLAMAAGDHPAAEHQFTEAMLTAIGSRHALVAAAAGSKQLYLRAVPLNQPQQARAAVPLATALNHRVEHDVDLYAEFLTNLGVVHAVTSEAPLARRRWEEAVALRDRHGRSETLRGLDTLANLGWLARSERRDEDMAAIYGRAVAVSEALLGPYHGAHLRHAWMLADSERRLGRPRQALARLGQLEQRFDRGTNNPLRGTILRDLGMIEIDEGRLADARAHLEQALAAVPETSEAHDTVLAERMRLLAAEGDGAAMEAAHRRALARLPAAPEPPDPRLHALRFAYARSLVALGRTAEAVAPLEQIQAALTGAGQALDAAEITTLLGELRTELGRLDEAEQDLRAAFAELERLAPPRSLLLAGNLVAQAELALARGRFAEAAGVAAQALAIYDAVSEPDHLPAARARFAHARALADDVPVAPAEARDLAEQALAAFRAKSRAADVARVATWLDGHPTSVSGP